MVTLTGIWTALFGVGTLALTATAVAGFVSAAGGDASSELGPLAALVGPTGAGVAAAGGALAAVAGRSLAALRSGTLVAVKGDCPACGEEVYAFVAAQPVPAVTPGGGTRAGMHAARHVADCHVCTRPIAFDVRVRGAAAAPWRRRAHGRIYLVSRASDFFPAAPEAGGKSAPLQQRREPQDEAPHAQAR
jgi:hypothetical protein